MSLGTEEHRQWSPTVTRETWNSHLTSSGFTGVDLAFPALDETVKSNALISTASEASSVDCQIPKAAILVLKDSRIQVEAAEQLRYTLKDVCEDCDILSLGGAKSAVSGAYTVCISLMELENSVLNNISDEDFNCLKPIFSNFETVIWASSETSATANPLIDMTTGLTRCLREENGTAKIVTIRLQKIESVPHAMTKVYKVLQRTLKSPASDCEVEFVEIDGLLSINRVAQYKKLDNFVARKTSRQRAQKRKFREDVSKPLKLAIEQLGNLSSLQYEVENSNSTDVMAANEIEIQVRAAGLNFRDVLIALGQDPARYLGIECSGVVIKVGEEAAAKFKIGDRVCCITTGCLQTNVRCDNTIAIHMPDDMSFQQAAAFPVAYSSAYYSLVHIARLQPRESILIHSGAGSFGQACIQLAKLYNATIFVTVGTDDKKDFLSKTYGISESNIFSSRNPDFMYGIKTLTGGHGVDVVVNSLAGEALKCSWDCIAPFGRFVEVGKKDIYNFGSLPMFPFSRNVTFSSVDIFYIYENSRQILADLMKSSMGLYRAGKITTATPIQVYRGSEVEAAFRYLESGKSKGKLVIEFHDDDIVPVSTQPTLDAS